MPDLPFDVVIIIVQFLAQGNKPVACYAGINRVWTEAIERRTFRHLFIGYNFDRFTIPRLARALQHDAGRRRSYVRNIDFMPANLDTWVRQETPSTLASLNDMFERNVAAFWALLSEWPPHARAQLSLELDLLSPRNAEMYRFYYSYSGDGPLPLLPVVKAFTISEQALIHPATATRLLASLPALQHADLNVFRVYETRWRSRPVDVCIVDDDTEADIDAALVSSLDALSYECTNVSLHFGHPPHQLGPGFCDAFLCGGLPLLAGHLKHLHLTGTAATPVVLDAMATTMWPHLLEFTAEFDADPTVEFYNDLHAAAGRAVCNMPELQYTRLGFTCYEDVDRSMKTTALELAFYRDKVGNWVVKWTSGPAPLELNVKTLRTWGIEKDPEEIYWKEEYSGFWEASEVVKVKR